MHSWCKIAVVLVALIALAACGRGEETPAAEVSESAVNASQPGEAESAVQDQTSALPRDYEGALPPTNQLILGIFELEGTGFAVTGAQAASMLPLWQALQSGTIQNPTERAAILRQLEGTLTETQVQAIGDLQLTFADLNEWARNNGIEMPQFGQDGQGGRGGQGGQSGQGGQGGQGGQSGPGGILADMSQEERAAFRQEMQSLSPEERRERLQEMGVEIPEGGFQGQGGPGGGGRLALLLEPLIELLESKAAL